MKTKDAFEVLAAAVRKRKFFLERMLEDRQHFPDEEDDDEDNVCISYESRNELHSFDIIVNSTYVQIKQLKQINGLINV